MSIFPPAAKQGAPKSAAPKIDAGMPTGGNPGTTDVVFPGRATPIPASKTKFSK